MTRRLRQDLFSKICSLSCGQVDRLTIPSLEARLTTDTYNTHQMVTSMQRLGVRSPILLLGGVLITLTLEPVLTLVLLAVLPFIALVIVGISKKGIPLYTRTQQGVDRLVQVVRENISGIRVIKALSKTEHECQRFDQINKELVRRETRAAVTMAASNPAMNLLLNTGLTLILVVGAFRVNSGLTKPGAIIAFLSYFTIILNAMLGVNRIFVLCSKGSASARRIDEVLSLEEDLKLKPSEPVDTGDHIASITFPLPMDRGRKASLISPSPSGPGDPGHHGSPPAPAKPPSSACSCASMIPPRERSAFPGGVWTASLPTNCG